MQRDTLGFLLDIRDSTHNLIEDTNGLTFEQFVADRRIRQVVERNFEIIGEAVNRLHRRDPAIVTRISAWQQIIGLRNALIHGYDVIDYSIVWQTIQNSLPVLQQEIDALLAGES